MTNANGPSGKPDGQADIQGRFRSGVSHTIELQYSTYLW